jgi:hypothetical protein
LFKKIQKMEERGRETEREGGFSVSHYTFIITNTSSPTAAATDAAADVA